VNKTDRALLGRFWRDFGAHYVGWLLLAGLLMMIEGGSLGLISYYVKPMFDQVFVAGNQAMIWGISLTLFMLFAARGIGAFGQQALTMYVGLKIIAQLQQQLLAHLLTLDMAFYHQHPPGALLERVRGDTQTLQQVAASAVIIIGRDSFTLVALLSVALYIDWQWMMIVLISVPLLVLPVWWVQQQVRRASYTARQASAMISSRVDEIFHGIKAIKINNAQAHESQRFATTLAQFLKEQFHAELGKAALPSLIDIIAGIGFVGVMIYGGQQIINGDKTVGDFMSFFTALALLFDPLRRLTGVGGQVQAALASLERLYQLFDHQPTLHNLPNAHHFSAAAKGDIRFVNVNFAYTPQHPVLHELNLVAPLGKITALVGPSGAGKTTVFNLLTRLIAPQSGEIYLGEQALSQLDMASLRDHIALVSQDSTLFDETIAQNVQYGRFTANLDQVQLAADQALVSEFCASLPLGLHTPAGVRGENLSGGQRQRVIIARAMLKNCPILLLDEATSALDQETEQKIQRALQQAAAGRTVLVIAHRLSTILHADVIHVLNQGRVVESGQHHQLLARQGLYARLYRQMTRA